MTVFPQDAVAGQRNAIARLWRTLSESRAARVGETTVVSTQVHMQDQSTPEDVSAILDSDAGKVFYHRTNPGEVLHVDIFHSPGCLDPRDVARNILAALSGIRFGAGGGSTCSMDAFLPYVDVQTAGGGGRIDGQLCYGQEQGVRSAHQTHVHIAALYAPETVASLFTLIAAVESAIEEGGLELRKVRRVRAVRGSSKVDISAYRASSDSLLRQSPAGEAGAETSVFRQEALARQLAGEVGSAEETRLLLERLSKGVRPAELAKMRFGSDRSPDEVRQTLARSNLVRFDGQKYTLTKDGVSALSFLTDHEHDIEAYLRRLVWSMPRESIPHGERKGHRIESGQNRGRGVVLPRRKGERFSDLAVPETAVAAAVRRVQVGKDAGNRGVPGCNARGTLTETTERNRTAKATLYKESSIYISGNDAIDNRYVLTDNAPGIPSDNIPPSTLGVPTAVIPKLPTADGGRRRNPVTTPGKIGIRQTPGDSGHAHTSNSLIPAIPAIDGGQAAAAGFLAQDLRFSHSKEKKGGPVILLLDASASMAGKRMRAAKELARHLILSTKDKISIVTFQDTDVKVVCPFTRSAKRVETGLSEIQAIGLTPLARGLEKALELASKSLKKPLVLCVTDGIPTVASHSVSPIDDALRAASNLAKRGIRLGCIGLEPNSGFLRQMVARAKGTLYVVEELEASTLAAIARKETISRVR